MALQRRVKSCILQLQSVNKIWSYIQFSESGRILFSLRNSQAIGIHSSSAAGRYSVA